jgi:hypothetical protein
VTSIDAYVTHAAAASWLALMAGFHLYFGARGVLFRRSFLISTRWLFTLASVLFGILLVSLAAAIHAGRASGETTLPASLILPVFLLLLWFAWNDRTYQVHGVDRTSLRDGVLASLAGMGLSGEAGPYAVRVPALNARIGLSMSSFGIGRVRMEGVGQERLFQDVLAGMRRHYASSTIATVWLGCYLYLVVGLACAAAFLSILAGHAL